MAEIKTLRAMKNQMRAAAGNLHYGFGTGPYGEVIKLGMWKWEDKLPELPALPLNATPRQNKDHRYAESLMREHPQILLRALVQCREVIGEAVELPMDFAREGYSATALARKLKGEGQKLHTAADVVIRYGSAAAKKLRQTRKVLAREYFESGNADQYLSTLGLDDLADEEPPDLDKRETQIAIQTAVFDVEIARALKPLSPIEKQMVLERQELPKHLDDPRVLAAMFRAPRVLLPFDAEEMAAIANTAFARNWPKTSAASLILEEMLAILRPVAGTAVYLVGNLTNPENPYDAFRTIAGGLWALEPMATERGGQAMSVLADMRMYSKPA